MPCVSPCGLFSLARPPSPLRLVLICECAVQGKVEQGLCEIADADTTKRFEAYCARPSGILPADAGFASRLSGKLYGAIGVDHLAKGLIHIAVEGSKERIIENDELLAL